MYQKDKITTNRPQSLERIRAELSRLLEQSGIILSYKQIEQLLTYHQILRQYNPELNLTRIHNFTNMVTKLYIDSILPGKMLDLPSPLMDLGTGPGMPGIPLKIAYPELDIILAESRRKRVDFLKLVIERLSIEGVNIVGEGITSHSEYSVAGVITRAVEKISDTLERIEGSLSRDGLAIFMKGPHCSEEIEEAVSMFQGRYVLEENRAYKIPRTPHDRRLVVFRRLDEPLRVRKMAAVGKHDAKIIESHENSTFKDLKKLLSSRGIKKGQKAIVCGSKVVSEVLRDFPEQCDAWISEYDQPPPPADASGQMKWFQLSTPLFRELDTLGTKFPLLLVRTRQLAVWRPTDGLPEGCSVLVPFQDPENVGAVIRSAVAFGANRIILLGESAHPYHPKALRSSGGSVLRAELLQGPPLNELPLELPIVALSAEGEDISTFTFPHTFGLLPGLEGGGLPLRWRNRSVSIPISNAVESLNAATATAIALYVWAKSALNRTS